MCMFEGFVYKVLVVFYNYNSAGTTAFTELVVILYNPGVVDIHVARLFVLCRNQSTLNL